MDNEHLTIEKLERKIQMLRTTNAGLMDEIEKNGGSLDITMARLEHFIASLVEAEIITPEHQMSEQFKWEKSLRDQLIPVRDAVRAKAEAVRERLKKAQASRTTVPSESEPQPPKLIVPKR